MEGGEKLPSGRADHGGQPLTLACCNAPMPRLRRPAPLLCGLAALALLALGGCAPGPGGTSVFGELGYLGQAAAGQGRLLLRARPIAAALRDPGVPAQTRHKLALVVQARDFAVAELGLGNTRSFQTYSDVGPARWSGMCTAPPG